MDTETLKSLSKVINYLARDEHEHWIAEGKPADHIHNDVERLRVFAERESKRR